MVNLYKVNHFLCSEVSPAVLLNASDQRELAVSGAAWGGDTAAPIFHIVAITLAFLIVLL